MTVRARKRIERAWRVAGALALFAALLGLALTSSADAAPANGKYPRGATIINVGDSGPSYRFYQEPNGTIAFDYSYDNGAAWQYGGNLGASLDQGERVSAMDFDGYIYVFITNRRTATNYYKRSQYDAWGVSPQGFGQFWTPIAR